MVSISNLSKSVKRKMIFSKVSFDIEDGQMLAIVGNKGTGKTTLVKIITGYEHVSEGTISIDGQNCTDNPAILRKCNAYIPVSQELYDKYPRQTVMENIKMFMHLNNLSLRENMGTVSGLLDYFNLTTLEKVKLKKLNPIQQLKLSIARALIINPRVLVLDEPFNNLNQEEILEAVNILDVFIQSGGSVVLTLTDIDLAAWLNCKVLILDGRTVVDGESYCRVYRNKNLPEDVEKEEQQEQYADDYYNDQYAGQYEYGYNNYDGNGDYNENSDYNAKDDEFNDNIEENDGNFDRVYGEEVNNEEYDQAFRGPSFNEQFGTGQIFDTVATESDESEDSQDVIDNVVQEEPEDNERLDAEFFRNQDNFRNNEDMRNQDNFRNYEDIRRQSIMRMQEEEQKRQEEERFRLEEEQRRQEEEERLRQEEEERRQEEERLRQEEEERRQEEERIRLEEEQREAERLRKEEEERLEELRRKEEEEAMPPRPELPPIRFTKTVEFFDNFGDVKEKRIGEEYFAVKDKMQGEEFLTKQFEALRILSNRRRELPQKED
ncbi:MAG: ABC transporter ATP-binding protein [Lachnospiraceae bacterium]|nr:ABC transporter ATP-binding protein [Lachnospiraceae bacterium]